MGKPRLIILIRHAQSEGNTNRNIHQMIPDHRVKLTDEGWKQAEEAGRRLRTLLKPDDTLQIYTSPYRRTRETTEGLLRTLTARNDPADPSASPSPFSRSKIKVYEEPRIREQDFGNFQPCSAEMSRMWNERADYGHFFYRIPNGESAADAYDRIAGFNESLWRQFGENDFPSVCVLVTHGLMTRVFLMKWYHWSVEYFEDLRNINHCEFILMKQNYDNGKYILENQLRTWSELKRQRAESGFAPPQRQKTLSSFLAMTEESPVIPARKWGGCIEGCKHEDELYPRRASQQKKQNQHELNLPPAAVDTSQNGESAQEALNTVTTEPAHDDARLKRAESESRSQLLNVPGAHAGHGTGTPHERSEDEDAGYFSHGKSRSLAVAMRKHPQPVTTPEDVQRWAAESGMGSGRRADALGDEPTSGDADSPDGMPSRLSTHSQIASSDQYEDLDRAEREDRSIRGSVY